MEGLPILLFIAFAIASVLEKVLKNPGGTQGGGQRPGQRPPGAPRPRPVPRRVPETPPRAQLPGAGQTGRADEMVPEEFWRELTGRPRQPEPPRPAAPPAELPSWDEDAIAHVEAAADEEAALPEVRSLEEYRRPAVVREPAPVAVSLETPLEPPEQRHAAYHQRLAAPSAAVAPTVAAASLRARLRRAETAREALVLAEVFGRPKGLE